MIWIVFMILGGLFPLALAILVPKVINVYHELSQEKHDFLISFDEFLEDYKRTPNSYKLNEYSVYKNCFPMHRGYTIGFDFIDTFKYCNFALKEKFKLDSLRNQERLERFKEDLEREKSFK